MVSEGIDVTGISKSAGAQTGAAIILVDRQSENAIVVISGANMSIFGMIGLIMLMGLVTKNAILLVDYANQKKAEGELKNALDSGGGLLLELSKVGAEVRLLTCSESIVSGLGAYPVTIAAMRRS